MSKKQIKDVEKKADDFDTPYKMTPDPEDTADNLPIDPRLANLKKGKPFKKGFDVRRNLRGVPKGTAEFRTHMRMIAAELIGKDETEMTRYAAMCRMFFTSRNPAHNKLALQVLDPKILTESVDLSNSDGSLTPVVNIYIPDNGRDKTTT